MIRASHHKCGRWWWICNTPAFVSPTSLAAQLQNSMQYARQFGLDLCRLERR